MDGTLTVPVIDFAEMRCAPALLCYELCYELLRNTQAHQMVV